MLSVATLWAGQWTALGPDGGDVRSLSLRPAESRPHLSWDTSTGTLFLSPRMGDTIGRAWPTWAAMTMFSITSR